MLSNYREDERSSKAIIVRTREDGKQKKRRKKQKREKRESNLNYMKERGVGNISIT